MARKTSASPSKSSASKRKDVSTSDEVEDHSKRAKVDVSEDMDLEGKNINNVIGGYKATLSNANASDEAKEHAQKMIDEFEAQGADTSDKPGIVDRKYERRSEYKDQRDESKNKHGKDIHHYIKSYKDTVAHKDTDEATKGKTQKKLDDLEGHRTAGGHLGHVIAGYKGTLSNPNVSEEAKEHARQMLEELGAEEGEYKTKADSHKHNRHGKDLSHFIGHYKNQSESGATEHKKSHAKKTHAEFEEHHKSGRHLGHVIGGYKATLSNPSVSDEAKEHARQMLEELDADEYDYTRPTHQLSDGDTTGKNFNNVMGGFKATLHNPNASEEAKEHARKMLEENGVSEEPMSHGKDDSEKNFNNVMGGYKATLHNPNASEEAKEHARKMLEENGVDEEAKSTAGKDDSEKNPGNVIGGLKAALKNPNTSDEARDEVRAKLNEKVAH